MKRILVIVGLAALMSACGNQMDKKSADKKSDSTTSVEKIKADPLKPGEKYIESYANGQPRIVKKMKKSGNKLVPAYLTEYFENGQISKEGPYKNGKRDGLWKTYYKTGELWSEIYFNNGQPDSNTTAYYPNGKIRYQGFYTKGQKSGTWKIFKEDGSIKELKHYVPK